MFYLTPAPTMPLIPNPSPARSSQEKGVGILHSLSHDPAQAGEWERARVRAYCILNFCSSIFFLAQSIVSFKFWSLGCISEAIL